MDSAALLVDDFASAFVESCSPDEDNHFPLVDSPVPVVGPAVLLVDPSLLVDSVASLDDLVVPAEATVVIGSAAPLEDPAVPFFTLGTPFVEAPDGLVGAGFLIGVLKSSMISMSESSSSLEKEGFRVAGLQFFWCASNFGVLICLRHTGHLD